MDYPCGVKIGDFGLSRFGFYRADRQTRQTESQMRMIAVGVSNK